jgi:hypothetical protein
MKKFLFSAIFIIFSGALSAQVEGTEPADTIVHIAGPKMIVNVSHITSSKIFYTYPDKDNIFEIDRKQVEKVVFRSGKVEIFNKPAFQVIQEDDWRSVFITKKAEDVEGLYLRGEVEVQAAAAKNRKETIRNAEIRLKKQAAGMNANIIHLLNTEFKGGYGDVPSITLKGLAYGFNELIIHETEEEQ